MLESLVEGMECPICYTTYQIPSIYPIELCRMHHTICRSCVLKVYPQNRCPFCRYSLHAEQVSYNKQIINGLGIGRWRRRVKRSENILKETLIIYQLKKKEKWGELEQYLESIEKQKQIKLYYEWVYPFAVYLLLFILVFDSILYLFDNSEGMFIQVNTVFLLPATLHSYFAFLVYHQLVCFVLLLLQPLWDKKLLPKLSLQKVNKYFRVCLWIMIIRHAICAVLQFAMFFGGAVWVADWPCLSYMAVYICVYTFNGYTFSKKIYLYLKSGD